MTTRTKLYIASIASSAMMMLNVLSHPLRLSEGVQWALILGVFVPLGLIFHYAKRLKQEKAKQVSFGIMKIEEIPNEQSKIRKRLVIIWICMVPFTLSAPFWQPSITGVSLGYRGDFLVALSSLGIVSLIFWIQLKKVPKETTGRI